MTDVFLRLTLALCCFLFAMHEYFVGYVEGASLQPDWIGELMLGEPVAGVPLLVAFGFFLIYHVGMHWRVSSRR
ncbi:MAG TPA: hypothetical protein VJO34_08950 [Methylomirabilota bacterium]|nr:hypothetical protein [Methylomirabilota bacterium]